jgi:hypothetical protein
MVKITTVKMFHGARPSLIRITTEQGALALPQKIFRFYLIFAAESVNVFS